MAAKQAYKKKITIGFVSNNSMEEIEASKLVYIVIEHMYEERIMPVIYLSISLETELYSRVLQEKDSAKIYLRVQSYDAYSDTSVYKDVINDQFTYFLASNTPEYTEDLADANSNVDSAYKTITMGLLDMSIMNSMRKTFGGIKKNIDQNTLIYSAVEDTKIIIKTPRYNVIYDNVVVPTITSRKDMIEWIFNEDPFYDTEYLYFMDFNTSYLLDRTGDAVSSGDGTLDGIVIDIKSVTAEEAYNEGMEIQNGNYYFYVNPSNTNVSIDVGTEKVANQLVASDDTGGSISTNVVDLNINKTTDTSTHQTVKRLDTSNAIVYKNAVESAQICIELVKENIDASIITPNKSFSVSNYEGYEDYNGKYVLLYKKEVIQGASSDFASIVTLGIKKVGKIQHIGKAGTTTSSNSKTTSTTARSSTYTTSTSKVATSSASSKATTTSSKTTTTSKTTKTSSTK